MRILLIEDSKQLQRSISKGLRSAGYHVDVTGDGEESLFYIESYEYDAVILDLMLPGLDGLSILKSVRNQNNPVHILILSAKDSVPDRIKGLNTGADDYLTKPFDFNELLARLQSLMRRRYQQKSNIIRIDDIEINLDMHQVSRNGEIIPLPPREYSLLEFLAMNRGKVISRSKIEEHIYDENADILSNVIDAAICFIRRRIDVPGKHSIIKTRRGHGYLIE